jgi:23S rRNA (adenine2503-C2)-methyltransferase
MPTPLTNIPIFRLRSEISAIGEPAFRATQIVKWLYQKRVDSFDAMTNLSAKTRAALASAFILRKLAVRARLESKLRDAVKFAFDLPDGSGAVESVLLIDGERRTACLSSQLGCGLGCVFCETGRSGFIRNLTQEEIVGQLTGINDYLAGSSDKLVTNIVFMGMGEALSNFENFRSSLNVIMAEDAFGIGGRKITVSTAGVVPSIDRLIQEGLNLGLAISLNAYSNEKRSAIMPINNAYPIEMLIDSARRYYGATGRRVTFEYVMVDPSACSTEAEDALVTLLGGLTCKINLIPLNPLRGATVSAPALGRQVQDFCDRLERRGLQATVRTSRGQDILGACGQLRAHIEGRCLAE